MKKQDRLPPWFRVRLRTEESYTRLKRMLDERGLNTVCQGARCPNIWECWNHGTATFMILGDTCTRNCRFCGVPGEARPCPPDPGEPWRVAETVDNLGLAWAVLTSVTRDDLPDYGSGHFAATVRAIHARRPACGVETLIPDFRGDADALRTVADCGAAVIAHNLETVPRLYGRARPEADYALSLRVLRILSGLSEGRYTVKSSLILGLGENEEEIRGVLTDMAEAGCGAATLGQYLTPGKSHTRVERYWSPEEFERLAAFAREAGIARVAAGPSVRSSYHAHELAGRGLRENPGPGAPGLCPSPG